MNNDKCLCIQCIPDTKFTSFIHDPFIDFLMEAKYQSLFSAVSSFFRHVSLIRRSLKHSNSPEYNVARLTDTFTSCTFTGRFIHLLLFGNQGKKALVLAIYSLYCGFCSFKLFSRSATPETFMINMVISTEPDAGM